jgi:hypothetical protein
MRIVVAGALANKPGYGGEAWVRLAWVKGLQALGNEVLFVEALASDALAENDPRIEFFDSVCAERRMEGEVALLDRRGRSLSGLPAEEVADFAQGADLLVNISGHLRWAPVTTGVRRRAYVDLDPGFTQFWQASGESGLNLEEHDIHFSVGQNIGRPGCPIPTGGFRWINLRQPVVLDDWRVEAPTSENRFTTLASFRGAYGAVEFGGHRFGLKVHEFRRFARLPEVLPPEAVVEVALDAHASDSSDLELLKARGWRLVDPRLVASTPGAFRDYVRGSAGELSVAQRIYVETWSGWFSDRSARYLATGRPVILQDTGLGRSLPLGEGLLTFGDPAEAAAGVREVLADPDRHRKAARRLAEEYFDARKVLTEFLEQALTKGVGSSTRASLANKGPAGLDPGAGPSSTGFPMGFSRKPLAIVAGSICNVPWQGGGTWAVLQYVLGLRRLGWDIHLVEEIDKDRMLPEGVQLEASKNARYFRHVARRFGLEGMATLVLSDKVQTVGARYGDLAGICERAEVLLNLSGVLRDPTLRGAPRVRAFLDLDPAFTQLWQEAQGVDMGLGGHTHFVSVGSEMGSPSCSLPKCGVEWIPTLPPVVLSEWPFQPPVTRDAWTTVANWRGYGSVDWAGVRYGQKAHAFRGFFSLPALSGDRFELALAIHPEERRDLDSLHAHGWHLVDPMMAAGTPDRYRRFVGGSVGEFGVAKAGYVTSSCGWFSDRSACYLASGRPVLAQDTGFGPYLPTGCGLIPFRTMEEAAEGVRAVRADYGRHARAARQIARGFLDSDLVLSTLLENVDACVTHP